MKLTQPIALVALVAGPVAAQTCLLTEGGLVPGVTPLVNVDSISNTAVNQNGGYAVSINCSDGLSRIWGNPTGGPGVALQTEATIGLFEQNSFESFFGIDNDGNVCYSPSTTNTVTLESGFDGVWLGDTIVAQEEDPIPSIPGTFWRFGSRPGLTANGIPYWVGGINDAPGGSSIGNGLFFGLSATPLYQTGDVLAGAAAPLSPNAVDFDARLSASGTHNITVLDVDVGPSEDGYVAMDGALITIGGGIMREGASLPAVAGGEPGELWDNFDFLGVNDAGDYMVTGDSDGIGIDTDEFILRNGAIIYREGDVVDGRTLTGAIEGAYMNEEGRVAYIWDIDDGLGGSSEALFVEGTYLLGEGDAIDANGDGVIDPSVTVQSFTGISALTFGADRRVYFTADVDVLGTPSTTDDVECLIVMLDPNAGDLVGAPATVSVSGGGTQNLFLTAPAAFAGELYWVLGSTSGTAPGLPVGAFTLPLNPDFYFDYTLSRPNVAPLVNTLANLGADARSVAQFALAPSAGALLVGLSIDHAYAVVDPVAGVVNYVSQTAPLTLVP